MNIKKILSIIIALIFISATFAGCRKVGGDDMSSGNASNLSSTVYDVVDIVENEGSDAQSSTESAVLDDAQSDVSSNHVSSDIFAENIVSVGDGGNLDNDFSEDDLPPTYIEGDNNSLNNSNTSNDGYSGETFATSPKNGKVVTVKIAPNSSVYYKIDRTANEILTINSPNAYVVYDGKKYTSQNGVVSFKVVSEKMLASDQILFEIGNTSSASESFTLIFASELGSMKNPQIVESVGTKYTATIKKGNAQGYFYKYKATNNGKIKFYLLSDAKKCKLTVGQLLKEYKDVVATGDSDTIEVAKYYTVSKDSTGVYIEFDVNNGDEFNISVSPLGVLDDSSISIDWIIVYN